VLTNPLIGLLVGEGDRSFSLQWHNVVLPMRQMPLNRCNVYATSQNCEVILMMHIIHFQCLEPSTVKGKDSSLDIAPLTVLDSGALQPRKWQLMGTGCSTAAQAGGCP